MTTPAPADTETQPLGPMSPAQLAHYAMRAWAVAADQIHDVHTAYDAWVQLNPPVSNVDTGQAHDHESYLSRQLSYRSEIKVLQGQMSFWLQVAQTAADVANLDDGEAEPVMLAGYDLAHARSWFERACARGESGEQLDPKDRAAARWRIMSPDQRAATTAIMRDVLVVAAEL